MKTPTAPAPVAIHRHTRFIKTPVITDVLQLQILQRGQWIKLDWCEHKSRFYGFRTTGRSYSVTAFHYPAAARQFASYCNPGDSLPSVHRAKPLTTRAKALLTAAS